MLFTYCGVHKMLAIVNTIVRELQLIIFITSKCYHKITVRATATAAAATTAAVTTTAAVAVTAAATAATAVVVVYSMSEIMNVVLGGGKCNRMRGLWIY